MKHGSNTRRSRNSNRSGRRTNPRMQVFDSNGPDVRIRGNAMQVHEKYVGLARDAASSGDHVLAESYLQHAEHYQRVLNDVNGQDNSKNTQKHPQKNTQKNTEKTGKAPSVKELVPEGKDMTLADELQLREERNQEKATKKLAKRASKAKTEDKQPEMA